MKVQIRRIDPAVETAGDGLRDIELYEPNVAAWVAIHDDPVDEPGPRRRPDWRLRLLVGLAGAIVGFGFVGGLDPGDDAGRGPAPTSVDSATTGVARAAADHDLPFALTSPREGGTIEGAIVEVKGVARDPLGATEFRIALGGAVLGRVAIDVSAAGPLAVSIPVFAPPFPVQVELLVTAAGSSILRRWLVIQSRGPVNIWGAVVDQAHGRTAVTVSGCAPLSVGRVSVRIATEAGRQLATTDAPVSSHKGPAGSSDGAAIGLGSFEARLGLPDPAVRGPLLVEVAWENPVGGTWGSSWITVGLGAPARHAAS